MENRIYDSKTNFNSFDISGLYTLPNFYGHVEDTEVFFPDEKIYMVVNKNGNIAFEDENRNELAKIVVTPDTKNNMHDNVYCKAESGKIKVWLPIVEYIDNYPHCDGEYDRWDVKYIAYDYIVFDVAGGTLEKTETESITN